MLCVPRGHPLLGDGPPTLAALAGQPLLMREPGSMTRQLVEQACQASAVELTRTTVFPTRESIKEAVAAGLGLGFVLSGEIGADARLCALPVADADEPVGVHVVCLAETLDLPTVGKLFELGAAKATDDYGSGPVGHAQR
jgi:DNA-binding transcriptional LysR family regulator